MGAATLAFPGDWHQATGGYRYDRALAAALPAQGWGITPLSLPASLPEADADARAAAEAALAARPPGEPLLIDGLALAGLPDAVQRLAARAPLVALIHHPVALETGLPRGRAERLAAGERTALAACSAVIATSAFTASQLARDYGVAPSELYVAPPGLTATETPTSRARPDGPVRLLCVGALTPRKGQDLLIDALSPLAPATPWHLDLVGPDDRDPAFARDLAARIAAAGLSDRVTCHGSLDDEAVQALLTASHVAVLPSRYEGYGMAVQEALAAGLPVIASDGGALAETANFPGCRQVPAEDVEALRSALAELIDDPAARRDLGAAASGLRGRWPAWSSAAAVAARALAAAATRFAQPLRSQGARE